MKTLINSEQDYREFVFDKLKMEGSYGFQMALEENLDVLIKHDCWDTIDGIDVDEDLNPIPDDSSSPDKLIFGDIISNISYPFIIIHCIDVGFDRIGDVESVWVEFVELREFQLKAKSINLKYAPHEQQKS